jgi:hypothetical protein
VGVGVGVGVWGGDWIVQGKAGFYQAQGGTARKASIIETSHTPFCETERRFCGLWSRKWLSPARLSDILSLFTPID